MASSWDISPERRSIALMRALGWQGGTIHQVAKESGCSAHELLHGPLYQSVRFFSGVRNWRYANELKRKYQGQLDWWLGVAVGRDREPYRPSAPSTEGKG